MATSFQCPHCNRQVRCAPEWAGKTARCPGCGQTVQVPAAAPGAAPGVEAASDSATRPCPQCAAKLKLTAALDGRKVRCPGCGATLLVSANPWGVQVASAAGAAGQSAPPQAAKPVVVQPVTVQPIPTRPAMPAPPQQPAAPAGDLLSSLYDLGATETAAPTLGQPLAAPALRPAAFQPRLRKSPLVPLLVVGGIGLALTAIVVGAVLWLTSGGGGGGAGGGLGGGSAGSSSVAPEFFLPDNAQIVASVDVQGILSSKLYRDLTAGAEDPIKQFQGEMVKEIGLTPADLKRATFASEALGPSPHFVAVLEFSKPLDPRKLASPPSGPLREEKVGNSLLWVKQEAMEIGLHLAGDRTLVVGSGPQMRAVLQRNRPVAFSGPMKDAVAKLDASRTVTVAMVISEQMLGPGGGMGPPGMAAGMPFQADMLKKLQGIALNAHMVGSDVQLAVTVLCAEEQAAEELQKMADGFLAMSKMGKTPPEAKKMLDSLKISRSGRNLIAQVTLDGAQFAPAIQAARQAAMQSAQRSKTRPGMGPGPGPGFPPGGRPKPPGFPPR